MKKKVVINWIESQLVGVRVDIRTIFKEPVFILQEIKKVAGFRDGKATDEILGYIYDCVDRKRYQHCKFKIEGQTIPLMTNEELQRRIDSDETVLVEIINGSVMAYVSQNNTIEDSFKADDIKLVETNF